MVFKSVDAEHSQWMLQHFHEGNAWNVRRHSAVTSQHLGFEPAPKNTF